MDLNKPLPKTLVIVPLYNEEESLAHVLQDLTTHLPAGCDVLLIDDGSRDRTGELMKASPFWQLSLAYNLGIGGAIQTGFQFASRKGYDIVVQFDGDGQHRAQDIAALVPELMAHPGCDILIGSRFLEKKGFLSTWPRRVGIWVLRGLLRILTGQRVTDPTSGFRAMRRPVFTILSQDYPDDFPEPEAILLFHHYGFRFMETPVVMATRQGGNSSISSRVALYYLVKVILSLCIQILRKPRRPEKP